MERGTEDALRAIALMTERSEKAQSKFSRGTSQYTLQANRIHALKVASALLRETSQGFPACAPTRDDVKRARAPIVSLIGKSEKAMQRLSPGTWQHAMLEENLKALHLALPLLRERLCDEGPPEG